MGILNFLLQNWDSVLVVVIVLTVIIFLIAKKEYKILDRIIFALVTEAERKYGGGTGQLKRDAVIDWVYPNIPAVIRLFISADKLKEIIEKVLSEAKEKWEKNSNILNYITGEDTE